MKSLVLDLAIFSFIICGFLQCTGKSNESPKGDSDPQMVVNDNQQDVQNADIPDLAFDDFLFRFMSDSVFQKKRILFPLQIQDVNGNKVFEEERKYDRMFTNLNLYTLICGKDDDLRAKENVKDSLIKVEIIYLRENRNRYYNFTKKGQYWFLQSIVDQSLKHKRDYDFYTFYVRFINDKKYQIQHIEDPLQFRTFDVENNQYLEGLLDREQWIDYSPELPTDTLTNIFYGNRKIDLNHRVVLVYSPSGGMGCVVTFEKNHGVWMLKKLEN